MLKNQSFSESFLLLDKGLFGLERKKIYSGIDLCEIFW